MSQYYWRLKEAIKDKIIWINWPEDLQRMIDVSINMNSCQWEWQMKQFRHQSEQTWTVSQISQYCDDSMNLDTVERHRSTLQRPESVFRNNKPFQRRNFLKSTETQKCYNCKKLKHLSWQCKKPYKDKKKMIATTLHSTFSWTVCYDDMCRIHMSNKDRSEWYSQMKEENLKRAFSKKLTILNK